MIYFKPEAEAAIRSVVFQARKPADEAGFDALGGVIGTGNGKMDDEGAGTLEVSVGERGQDHCNGNTDGAATLKVPGGVVSSMAKDDVDMGALGAHGASPSLGADESMGDTISEHESPKSIHL
jgi:hypothetical protein